MRIFGKESKDICLKQEKYELKFNFVHVVHLTINFFVSFFVLSIPRKKKSGSILAGTVLSKE